MHRERTTGHFDEFDFGGFWAHGEWTYAYFEPELSAMQVVAAECVFGKRLPDAYVELASRTNGGGLVRAHPTPSPAGRGENHVELWGIFGIGRTASRTLLGSQGARFMRDVWGYPEWGVGIGDTPAGTRELVMLDYRECGTEGEPSVVHVDRGAGYATVVLAPDFATFIRGLVPAADKPRMVG